MSSTNAATVYVSVNTQTDEFLNCTDKAFEDHRMALKEDDPRAGEPLDEGEQSQRGVDGVLSDKERDETWNCFTEWLQSKRDYITNQITEQCSAVEIIDCSFDPIDSTVSYVFMRTDDNGDGKKGSTKYANSILADVSYRPKVTYTFRTTDGEAPMNSIDLQVQLTGVCRLKKQDDGSFVWGQVETREQPKEGVEVRLEALKQ